MAARNGRLDRISANVVRGTVLGTGEVVKELGTTATSAARGSLRAAEQITGDLIGVAKSAVAGALDSIERIGSATERAVRMMVNGEAGRAHAPRARKGPQAAMSRRRSRRAGAQKSGRERAAG